MDPKPLIDGRLLAELTDKLAIELVFAEAGKDVGLLPANSFLMEMDALCDASSSHPEISAGVKQARAWVDRILDGDGYFDRETLKNLQDFIVWIPEALRTVAAGEDPAPLAGMRVATPGTGETPTLAEPSPASSPEADTPPALEMNLDRDLELLQEFCHESHEHLQNIENGVLVLEANPSDHDTLNSVFRAFHTFKGGSGFLNLIPVNRLAHELESLLDLARQEKLRVTPEITDIILSGGDTLGRFVADMEAQIGGQATRGPILIPIGDLIKEVHAAIAGQAADGPPASAEGPATASVAPASEATVSSPAASTNPVPQLTPLPVDAPPVSLRSTAPGPGVPAASEGSARVGGQSMVVKVDTQKLDGLLDLVGELVIAQSLVAQDPVIGGIQSQVFTRNLALLGRITNELQRTAMSLRLVPIRAMFQKMNRLVRDLANGQGKKIELTMSGEDTELDRTIIEELSDPLMHMIRNAVDHGIEKPEVRAAKGKPAKGTIHLAACHEGGAVVIEVKDDGGGLNKDRIIAKAVEQGLLRQGEQVEDKDAFKLIFAAGFSTAEKVTDISGRGVGMDVVRRNIERLRGKIEIESALGKGSTFSIFLPLTLAIIDGLIVGVGDHRFIVPTLSVRESFQPTAEMISTLQGRGEVVNVRGRLRPLLRLHEYLNIPPLSNDPTNGILMVIEAGHDARCLLVDQLLGKQEVVIKSLGETFKHNHALAGATILGDGRVGLILDPNALVKLKPAALATAA